MQATDRQVQQVRFLGQVGWACPTEDRDQVWAVCLQPRARQTHLPRKRSRKAQNPVPLAQEPQTQTQLPTSSHVKSLSHLVAGTAISKSQLSPWSGVSEHPLRLALDQGPGGQRQGQGDELNLSPKNQCRVDIFSDLSAIKFITNTKKGGWGIML